jgi:putative oxidoreductase
MRFKSKEMKQKLFQTEESWTPFLLRVFLALVVFPHGAQKLFGWFGGFGFSGTMNFFTENMGLPWLIGFMVIMLETIGAIALLLGLATRFWAFSYTFLALGIVFSTHIENGFFMNWFGNQAGEGYEYFLLWIGISLALLLTGGGKYSVDRQISLQLPEKAY